jgi:outer membrane biosynthesis protein TonB
MRKLIVVLLVTSIALPFVNGQGNAPIGWTAPTPKPVATKPAPEKPSFFKRFFGPLPTPTPIPRPMRTPTPAPTVKRRPSPKPKPVATEQRTAVATPKTPTEPEVKAPEKPAVKPPVKPAVKPTAKTTSKSKTPAAAADVTGLDDPVKFRTAKLAAMEDPAIKDLKTKADSEVDEAEAQKALSAYNRALFRKIREIDPSVSEYVDRVEQSMTKRIGAEKGKE